VAMIDAAVAAGKIGPDTIVLEPTSGNTGIGLAMVCAARGIKSAFVMPETMSRERKLLLKAYGADLILTPGAEGMTGAINQSQGDWPRLIRAISSRSNSKIRRIRRFTATRQRKKSGAIPMARLIFLSPVSVPVGPITGVGEALKAKKPGVSIVAVEPDASPGAFWRRQGAAPDSGYWCRFRAGRTEYGDLR
jgi:cysteine synthase A